MGRGLGDGGSGGGAHKPKFIIVSLSKEMGSSRKYPYPYHGWHFGIPNAWGVLWPGIPNARGSCWDWNSECMREFLVLEFRRGEG